jgi:glycosyltransferase involved in cell wall biosynthesis
MKSIRKNRARSLINPVDLEPCTAAGETPGGASSISIIRSSHSEISIALLTAGIDKHYAYGLATALASKGVAMDLIAGDELEGPELRGIPRANFLNLRGSQRSDAKKLAKVLRISRYYAKLMCYAASSRARLFHILWNNRFEAFDRTLLMLYYKLLRKRVVLTAHNINKEKRDAQDSRLNRLTLRIQYHLADHVFVHTAKMKSELIDEFGLRQNRITIIPFGINNAIPQSQLSCPEARERLGIRDTEKTLLFFGQIAPYKGLDYLVTAFQTRLAERDDYRLIIAGRPKPGCEEYWRTIESAIQKDVSSGRILVRADFIPDSDIELYCKAADILVLPYRHIFQSGVLFVGFSFGLPVLAADVGSLKDEIVEGETGFVFKPDDPADLAKAIDRYFMSDLFANIRNRREKIQVFANRNHSWDRVSELTLGVYSELLGLGSGRSK